MEDLEPKQRFIWYAVSFAVAALGIGIFLVIAALGTDRIDERFKTLEESGSNVEAELYEKEWTSGRYNFLKFTYAFEDGTTITENMSLRENTLNFDEEYVVGDKITVCRFENSVAGDFELCGKG